MAMSDAFFCAEQSRNMDNPLIGTVKPFSYLFLLEYHGSFGSKALRDSYIPEEVKGHITHGLKTVEEHMGKAKFLLIKNQHSREENEINLFVLQNNPDKPLIRRYTLEYYEQLLRSSLRDLIDPKGGDPVEAPMYLICTNGNRDKCCSKFGFPLYRSLYDSIPDPERYVWECSHVGGHRFAGNVITLPDACFYGFVDPKDLLALVAHTEEKRIYLKKLRGRSSLSNEAQVVEKFLMEKENNNRLGAFKWEGIEKYGDKEILAQARLDGKPFRIQLIKEEILMGGSCDKPESKMGTTYKLGEITSRTSAQQSS